MKKYFITLFYTLTIIYSNIALSNGNTIPINTGHKKVTENLILKLSAEKSWFKKINETTVLVKLPITSKLQHFLEIEANKTIPRDKSLSATKEIRQELYSSLKGQNIEFTIVIYDSKEFIVWKEKDTKTINDTMSFIIESELSKLHVN